MPIAGSDIAGLEIKPAPRTPAIPGWRSAQRLFLKAFRRVRDGINPDVEIGRFLTEVRAPQHRSPGGNGRLVAASGTTATLAVLQGYVEN
jgi:predicted trehalose synthase